MNDTPAAVTLLGAGLEDDCLQLEVTLETETTILTFGVDDVVWIGRSSKCQVQLAADSASEVSRFHARVLRGAKGWVVVDQSQAGTMINSARLTPEVETPLRVDDVIAIGPHRLRVVRSGRRAAAAMYTLTVAQVNLARLDPKPLLSSVLELPARLGAAGSETGVYECACEYLIAALSPAVTSVYVVVAHEDGDGETTLLARRGASGDELPLVSHRVVQAVREAAEAVVFLQQTNPSEMLDATVTRGTRAVGACLLEYSVEGDPILIYTLGERAVAGGKDIVAGYLRLITTLTRQHILTQRRVGLTKYFSPKVIELLMQPGGRARAEGEPRVVEATSMFFDLRGFSVSTESSAEDLQPLYRDLRSVMDVVTDAVFETGGTIIDYQGDGCFAAWGVPFDDPEHSVAAVRCALMIRQRLREAQLGSLAEGSGGICGIGIASGPVLAGAVGSSAQFKFGLLGPSVNMASRLEALTKPNRLNAPVLITDEVMRRALETGIATVRVARVLPAGMTREIDVHQVCEPGTALAEPAFAASWHEQLEALERVRSPEELDTLMQTARDPSGTNPRLTWLRGCCAQLREPARMAEWRGVVAYPKG